MMTVVAQPLSRRMDPPPRPSLRSDADDDSFSDDSTDFPLAERPLPPRISVDFSCPLSRVPARHPTATVHRVERLSEVIPLIGDYLARSAIFKDIDETALHLVRGGIDIRDLYVWASGKQQSKNCSTEEAERIKLWALNTFPAVPVEPTSLDLCRELQTSAKTYLYLTARSVLIADLTQKHLREFPPGLRIPNIAPEGVYFTNATCKGRAIRHLNEACEEIRAAEVFVLIDDNPEYIRGAALECAGLRKLIILIHYVKPHIPKLPSDEDVNSLLVEDGLSPFTPSHSGDPTL